MEVIQAELISFLMVVLTTCVGLVTRNVMSFLKKKGIVAQIEGNREIVRIVVEAVEQTYTQLNGEEKFELAKTKLIELMNNKKIDMTIDELNLIIEAMVKEMNDAIIVSEKEEN